MKSSSSSQSIRESRSSSKGQNVLSEPLGEVGDGSVTRDVTAHDERRQLEHLPTTIYADDEVASLYVAGEIASLIRRRAKEGKQAVLGLATGSTPTGVYSELVRQHKEEGLSFANVVTFNLDEYYPIAPDALQSYVRYMNEQIFDHVDIPPENVHIPDGALERDAVPAYCRAFEEQIVEEGGLDIQLLGIGRTGHIGFNEPGSNERTRTRLVTLDDVTRQDAAKDFLGKENVPRRAITMGIGTILDARRIFLMAWGEHKADVVHQTVEGGVTDRIPATYLQRHRNTEVVLDPASASQLTRRRTPWQVGYCEWDDELIRRAVVWLSDRQDKPILKLTDADYNENGMSDILTDHGPAYNTNIDIFNHLQHTITGWPGGKPNADDTKRPERAAPHSKRCLVFSPHPGDAAISMGGTILRLVDQGHEVHVAYQTSGDVSVHDDEALRFAEFMSDFQKASRQKPTNGEGAEGKEGTIAERVRRHVTEKSTGDTDAEVVRLIKELIRRGEAKSACRYCNIPEQNVHFLQMPFYETGRAQKKPLSEEDVRRVTNLLQEVEPHQIYATGDLADPHGTHRICMDALKEALQQLSTEDWLNNCYIWRYRGAWKEWETSEIGMAVPLSPEELNRKKAAILKHESQKDRPQYPGSDTREFWERAIDRAKSTAAHYDALGLAEYEAIESFARL